MIKEFNKTSRHKGSFPMRETHSTTLKKKSEKNTEK